MLPAQDFSALPDSLLLQILSYLPLRDRLGGARVCRRWHRLVRDKSLWRHLDLTPYKITSKALWHLLRNHLRGNLQTLKAQGTLLSVWKQEVFSPALMRALGKQCPNLHCLCLTETDLSLHSYDCIPPSLKTLELNCCEIPSVWFQVPTAPQTPQAFPRIQNLKIWNVPAFSNQHLVNISVQGTLRTLFLSETYRVTDTGIQTSASHMEDLEHLALHQCTVGDLAIHFISRHMKRLHSLDLRGSASLTDAGLSCLTGLPGLEDLSLESCGRLSPEAIVAVCQALPRLKHLNVSRIAFADQTINDIQARLPNCVVTSTAAPTNFSVKS